MEKRRFSLSILLLLCGFLCLQAQWDDPPGQFLAVKGYYNPSFAGETEAISTTTLYRYQWTGVENAPRQIFLTADMPFEFSGRRHGAGLAACTETIGELRNSLLAAQYSFKMETGKGFLSIGLQAGAYDLNFDAGSKLVAGDSLRYSRGILSVDQTDKQVIDLGAGISWRGRNFFAGVSAMHINQPHFYTRNDSLSVDLQSDSARSAVPRLYNFIAGYNITLFHPLDIEPVVRVQTDLSNTQLEVGLRLEYNKKFSGGASWRMDDGYVLFAETVIRDIELGYACGLHTSGAGQKSMGSHEFYLRYDIPLDIFKPKRQPHKSIRLL